MQCEHQLALCKARNCTTCEYKGYEDRCPFARREVGSVPTFAQMIGIYADGRSSRRHKSSVVGTISADVKAVGLNLDSPCSEMTRARFKQLIELLHSPDAKGRIRRSQTINSHLTAFRSITSEWTEDRYNELGFELPRFNIPHFKVDRQPVQEVSDKTIRKVEIQMEKWLATGKSGDRDAYVFCFFALYCGLRAGDICRLKWEAIQRTSAGILVVYKPHKTLCSTGITVSVPLPNRVFCKIEPLIGSPDEFVITRYSNRASKHVHRHGEYDGFHSCLRSKVNRALSNIGIGNEYRGQKKTHALRKYFETDRVFTVGGLQAARECGHSIEIQRRNYLGTLVGKVA